MIAELLTGPAGPAVIFLLRIVDVSMSTLRTLLVVRGARLMPPLIGFFEVMIWIFAVGGAIGNLDSPLHVLGYAAGFATGNVVGPFIEQRIAYGFASVRTVVAGISAPAVLAELRNQGYKLTEFEGRGQSGPVSLIYSVVPRKRVPALVRSIEQIEPNALVVVDEPRRVRQGPAFEKLAK